LAREPHFSPTVTHETEEVMPGSDPRTNPSDAHSASPHSVAGKSAPPDGALVQVDVDLLDENPFQPRTTLDEALLADLAASISVSGLLQPIAVRPSAGGRYQIVAGHRRVAAFKKLKASAASDEERRRYRLIPATVKRSMDDRQMAVGAYVENASRSDLSPLEEAAALVKIKQLAGASNAKELAAVVGQNEQRVRRLLRLADAPKVVRDALTNGLLVDIDRGDSAGRRERRRLDLLAAIEFIRLHEHLLARKPSTAEERVGGVIRRALADAWGLRRVQEHVESVLSGHAAAARSSGSRSAGQPLLEQSRNRVVVHLPRAVSATAEQFASAAKVLNDLAMEFTARSADAPNEVQGDRPSTSDSGAMS
jgi:ParB family transcriptional regulator, chromosome partitioning protein